MARQPRPATTFNVMIRARMRFPHDESLAGIVALKNGRIRPVSITSW
jgi:hypothetical protein